LDTLTDFKAGWSPGPWRTNEEGNLLINERKQIKSIYRQMW
jgi:hypothetical protein